MLPQASDSWTLIEAAHLLNRAGFGGSPQEIQKLHALGRIQAVDSLLNPAEPIGSIPVPLWATREQAIADMRERAEQLRMVQEATRTLSAEEAEKVRKETFQAIQRENREHGFEAQGWWFRAMLLTQAPLREKMTLFWHDHFATSLQKVRQPALLMLQNDLFRRHATGNFRQLTHAVLRDPAMMLYLDTQSSKKGKPNENFAREVMELFTLGEGHYTELDIREASRAFTGYQLNRSDATVRHNKRQWDEGDKTIFGKTGKFTGDDIIDLIFEKPEAAKLLAGKLWEYFAAEGPSPETIEALAATLRSAKYETAPVLREIFLSKAFYAEGVVRNQIKSPVQYFIQLLKQLELREAPQGYTRLALEQLGQSLFQPPNVAGWDWGKAWINTNTLLARYNLAGFITKGSQEAPASPPMAREDAMNPEAGMDSPDAAKAVAKAAKKKTPGDRMSNVTTVAARFWRGPDYEKIVPRALRNRPEDMVDAMIFRFLQTTLPAKHRDRFVALAKEKEGVVFTNHEVAELAHFMLSTPDYQLT